jgi:hypothetical protein
MNSSKANQSGRHGSRDFHRDRIGGHGRKFGFRLPHIGHVGEGGAGQAGLAVPSAAHDASRTVSMKQMERTTDCQKGQ